MIMRLSLAAAVIAATTLSVSAQQSDVEVDCSLPANAELTECLNLPDPEVTNVDTLTGPLIAGLVGLAALGLGGGGGGGTPSTTSTTATTSTP